MGTLVGHVAPGAGFLIIGLWHLFNMIRDYAAKGPWRYETRPWYPAGRGRLRHLELWAIMGGAALSIAAELFIGPQRHQPLADDLSIPPEHLNNFEHSTISLFLFMYAAVALAADRSASVAGATAAAAEAGIHALAGLAFAQELLLFHLHSADHMGLEGHYHWLLQLIVAVSLLSTLLEIPARRSFVLGLTRGLSLVFQGAWFIQMGLVLWIPRFTPTGCRLHDETYHSAVRCDTDVDTMRAKALATLQFSWYLAAITAATVAAVAVALKKYATPSSSSDPAFSGGNGALAGKTGYQSITDDDDDVEVGPSTKLVGGSSPGGGSHASETSLPRSLTPFSLER